MSISNSGSPATEKGRRPGRPTGRDVGKYEALLEAARKLFLMESYQRVTTRELAAAAGVDIALIGYYFGSKEGLYRAMFSEIYDGALKHLRRRARGAQPQSIAGLFEMVYEIYREYPELALLMFRTLVLGEGPSREFLLKDIVQQLRSHVVGVFDELKAQGLLDSQFDTQMLEDAFASLCFRPFQMRALWVEQMGEEAADRYIRGLFAQNAQLFERAVACEGS